MNVLSRQWHPVQLNVPASSVGNVVRPLATARSRKTACELTAAGGGYATLFALQAAGYYRPGALAYAGAGVHAGCTPKNWGLGRRVGRQRLRGQPPPERTGLMDMDIRPCRQEDLRLLEAGNPSPGQTRYHDRRFERQQQGASTFLIAWAEDFPAGHGEIMWNGCAAPEVREHYPDCPEINGLEVWPPERRSHGIGTAIIRAAESLVRDRGCHQTGLGVDDDNHRAAALYERLGYQQTGIGYLDRYYYLDDHGHRHDIADPAQFLVKQLTEHQPGTSHPRPEQHNSATHSSSRDT